MRMREKRPDDEDEREKYLTMRMREKRPDDEDEREKDLTTMRMREKKTVKRATV